MKKVIRAAVDLFETFRGRSPRRIKRVTMDVPEAVAVIGHVDYIGYRTTYEDKSELYEHEFQPGSRPLLCVNADGKQLVLLGGRYVFDKHHGIVDKDARGRKVLDPDHGKDIGFMRVRQANPGKKGGRGPKLAQVDFGNQAYRGYMIRKNSLTGQMWIEKDGHLIGRVPEQHSWEWARAEIDSLLD